MKISSERVRGRDKEKETIIRFLTENRSKTVVVTIWGIGGIGKTALARLVCEDEKVQSHFHPLLWANARDAFHLKTIIEDLLELDHDCRGILSIDELQKRLKRRIEGNTCLLVLDDVGKLNPEQCQELRDLFKVGIAGVLIATVEYQDIDLVNKDEIEVSRKPTQAHMTIKKKTGSHIVKLGEEVGIEEGKKNIKDFFLEESEYKLSTLFIGGVMDAENDPVQLICNDVKDKFEFFKWVHVPCEEFNLKRIVRGILDEEEQDKTLEQLQIKLQEKLQEKKRFLIGLDVYGMNAYQCDELEVLLMKNGKVGNKLLIVTRDKQVPPIAHMKMHLGFLSIADFPNLVVKNAEFAEIRREIIEGCSGVPLLLRIFGGILSHETDENKLKKIQEKIKNSSDVSEILKLSFDTLPPHIKMCFMYSTCFTLHPRERGRLTQQWIAHDLIEGTENNRKLEDIAREYFDELLSRSFFYNLVEDDLMAEARFEVHDLVYKLAHKVSERDESENFPSLRKLKELTYKLKIFGPSSATSDMLLDSLSRSLRVLDLSGSEFEELPSSIGELRDLRYLDVSYNIYLDELPNSLFELSNLETLRFEECGILELSRDFSKLKKLRNLYACTEQVSIPEEVICGLASLRILHLNPVHNLETLPKSLENLTALETLVLRFCSQLTLLDTDIKGLKSLRSLTITHIKNKKSSLIPSSLKDAAASSLSSLCLSYCMGMTTLPEWLVKLQCLRRLHVEFCPNLTPSPKGIFLPNCLEYLSIRGCLELTKICESEDWQQEHKDILEIHLDGRIIRPISDTRSSNATSPSSVHVEKDSRNKGKITDVRSSKLPSLASSGPVEEIYEGKAMIQSTPYFESSIPSASSSDLIMFDVEDQALELAGKDNPLTTNIKKEPAISLKHRQELECLTITSQPFRTLKFFSLAIGTYMRQSISYLLAKGGLVLFMACFLGALGFIFVTIDSLYEKHFEELCHYFWFVTWWVGLGVLSSIGLGPGLTFVLYLGPHIAFFTLKAVECGRVDLKTAPYDTIQLTRAPSWLNKDCSDIGPPVFPASHGFVVPLSSILPQVQLEALLWGLGTALGELPSYFISREASLSGGTVDAMEKLNASGPEDKGFLVTHLNRLKWWSLSHPQHLNFFAILVLASVPNPRFDHLAGIMCGQFGISFWNFFFATLIGKAIIKTHIQMAFIILVCNNQLLNWIEDEFILLLNSILGFASIDLIAMNAMRDKYLAAKPSVASLLKVKWDFLVATVWNTIVWLMLMNFFIKFVNATAQNYLKKQQEEEMELLTDKSTGSTRSNKASNRVRK